MKLKPWYKLRNDDCSVLLPLFSLLGYIRGKGLKSSGGGKSSTGWNWNLDSKSSAGVESRYS